MPVLHDVLDGRYELLQEIGMGGAGVVFLGYHLTLDKYVVIKKLKADVREYLNIRGETDILKQLHHRYLPQVYDFLIVDDEVYTVMDYVDGHDLLWYIDQGVVFSEREILRMLLQLCEVLEYLHGQNPPVIHRDIKPGNIMLRENGDVCLIDFNISFAGVGEEVQGYSLHYAPPEQLEQIRRMRRGEAIRPAADPRGDLYSLGATFYYLTTGERHGGYRSDALVGTAYSARLMAILRKAMAEDPQKRYRDAARMRRALERCAGRTRRILTVVLSLAAVFLLILAGMYLYLAEKQKKEAAFAREYSAYVQTLSAGEAQDWIEEGLSILNEGDYRSLLQKNGAQNAVILEGVADGYYETENYREAAAYYREALSLEESGERQGETVRDLVLALIRDGQTAEARSELILWQTRLSSEELAYLEIEFLLQEGAAGEAAVRIAESLETAQDQEIRFRLSLYGAQCLGAEGDQQARTAYLQIAESCALTRLEYRRTGDAYLEILQDNPGETVFQEALAGAGRCYEKACASLGAGYVDRLNLAVIEELQGDYGEALQLLTELIEEAPEDYRAYREAAFASYQRELEKPARERSMHSVIRYGEQALSRYQGSGDEQMIQLEELLSRLKEES